MTPKWMKQIPPYEGDQPYLYLAFAEEDSGRVWKLLRPLLARGCRVWYCVGPAGSAEELLYRQERCEKAGLTVVYLTDALCADRDSKSAVLVNQKYNRPILCLDPDEKDRRLDMNLRETVPHVSLYQLSSEEWEGAVLHAEGFSQDMLGEPIRIGDDSKTIKKLTLTFCTLALLLAVVSFAGFRVFGWFSPAARDEVDIRDPAIRFAVRQAVGGGAITEERANEVSFLRFRELPESWEDLSLLPALERIELPQRSLLDGGELPDGDWIVELSGGDGA
ncbi:MAG: hypothetical protein IKF48_01660 [Oscillospiraceae bacterium]|nr:hypothetical protein [Oscillospiraceae bacterium]